MNTFLINDLVRYKTSNILYHTDIQLVAFNRVTTNSEIYQYLSTCLSDDDYTASGINVCSFLSLIQENLEEANPGKYIYPFGYLVIGTSIGGNAICFHEQTGMVVWADRACFMPQQVAYKEQNTGKWLYLEGYSDENVNKAMYTISDNIEQFLIDLLNDRLQELLDELD